MGFTLGVVAIAILFQRSPVSESRLLLAALLASIYWLCIFAAPIFPETAFTDPEFVSVNPTPLGFPAQLIIGFVLATILAAAVGLAHFSSHQPLRARGDSSTADAFGLTAGRLR
jgi:hypothetical protein